MNNQPKLSRRSFVSLAAAGLASTAIIGQTPGNQKTYAYVGSWSDGGLGASDGSGGGISVFEVLPDGSLVFQSKTAPELESLQADYLTISADGRYLYSVHATNELNGETAAGGGIFSFSISPTDGSLTHLNSQPSMGNMPTMVTIDATGKILLASNHGSPGVVTRVSTENGVPVIDKTYDDSTVALYPINSDGSLGAATDVAILDRVGGVPGMPFQESPHAHAVVFDPTNRRVLVADKGANRLYSYRVNKTDMRFEEAQHLELAPGVMPRHIAFHPTAPFAFVSNEGEASLSSIRFDSNTGDMTFLETVPSTEGGGRRDRPSDIKMHPNGNFLYTATRGSDVIAVHQVNQATGLLQAVEFVSSVGSSPRGITFDPTGNYLFVANQRSSEVRSFVVDSESGRITPTGAAAEVPRPANVQFVQL